MCRYFHAYIVYKGAMCAVICFCLQDFNQQTFLQDKMLLFTKDHKCSIYTFIYIYIYTELMCIYFMHLFCPMCTVIRSPLQNLDFHHQLNAKYFCQDKTLLEDQKCTHLCTHVYTLLYLSIYTHIRRWFCILRKDVHRFVCI